MRVRMTMMRGRSARIWFGEEMVLWMVDGDICLGDVWDGIDTFNASSSGFGGDVGVVDGESA